MREMQMSGRPLIVRRINPGRWTCTHGVSCSFAPLTFIIGHTLQFMSRDAHSDVSARKYAETGIKKNKFCILSWHESHQLYGNKFLPMNCSLSLIHLICWESGTVWGRFPSKSNTNSIFSPRKFGRSHSHVNTSHPSVFSFPYRQHTTYF